MADTRLASPSPPWAGKKPERSASSIWDQVRCYRQQHSGPFQAGRHEMGGRPRSGGERHDRVEFARTAARVTLDAPPPPQRSPGQAPPVPAIVALSSRAAPDEASECAALPHLTPEADALRPHIREHLTQASAERVHSPTAAPGIGIVCHGVSTCNHWNQRSGW